MDKAGQFVDVADFDPSKVNCEKTPNSAEEYLRQVVVGRRQCPDFTSSPSLPPAAKPLSHPNLRVLNTEKSDPHSATADWVKAKSDDFVEKRERLLQAPRPPKITVTLPKASDEEEWEELIVEKCLPEFAHLLPQFPNHVATPPALAIVRGLSQPQVHALIEYVVEWSHAQGFSRPLREWLYALMLVVDIPLLHDVVAALREVARMCRSLRSAMTADRVEDIAELSLFIAVISICFGQRDLAD